jgi:hypothetical protein
MKEPKELTAPEASLEACPFCGSADVGIEVREGLHGKPLFWIQCRVPGIYSSKYRQQGRRRGLEPAGKIRAGYGLGGGYGKTENRP